jgi:hypothetical protein
VSIAVEQLTIVPFGNGRLSKLLRQKNLIPVGTRIRTRLVMEPATRDELHGMDENHAGDERATCRGSYAATICRDLLKTLASRALQPSNLRQQLAILG